MNIPFLFFLFSGLTIFGISIFLFISGTANPTESTWIAMLGIILTFLAFAVFRKKENDKK